MAPLPSRNCSIAPAALLALDDQCARYNPLNSIRFSPDITSNRGGALCRPLQRPQPVSRTEMGRERPRPRIAKAAPGPPAGSLTPQVSVTETCGRRARRVSRIAHRNSPDARPDLGSDRGWICGREERRVSGTSWARLTSDRMPPGPEETRCDARATALVLVSALLRAYRLDFHIRPPTTRRAGCVESETLCPASVAQCFFDSNTFRIVSISALCSSASSPEIPSAASSRSMSKSVGRPSRCHAACKAA